MSRFLKTVLPYTLVAVGLVVGFAAGQYSSSYFAGLMFNPRLGQQEVTRLAADHAVLQLLDEGNVNQARSLLVLREDGLILGLSSLSTYLPGESAQSACRLLQAVASHRIESATETQAEIQESADVRNLVSASLRSPVACKRTK
jgi:hypothetical protein